MEFYLYDHEKPEGFVYPKSFLKEIGQDPVFDWEPWEYMGRQKDLTVWWFNTLKEQYPDRLLIPFAKVLYQDDIACFDGNDHSGDPVVHYVHSFASPGWEDHGNVKNFDAWLENTKKEHYEWKADQEL